MNILHTYARMCRMGIQHTHTPSVMHTHTHVCTYICMYTIECTWLCKPAAAVKIAWAFCRWDPPT